MEALAGEMLLLAFAAQTFSCAGVKTPGGSSWLWVLGDCFHSSQTAPAPIFSVEDHRGGRDATSGKGVLRPPMLATHRPLLHSAEEAGARSCSELGQSFAKPHVGAASPDRASVSPYNIELIATLFTSEKHF